MEWQGRGGFQVSQGDWAHEEGAGARAPGLPTCCAIGAYGEALGSS